MTLVVAVPTREGVVLASDSQVTTGPVRARGQKVFQRGTHSAWSAAGELALIQRVREAIDLTPVDQPLDSIRDVLAGAIKQCVTTLIQLDFRTQFLPANPDAMLSLHPGDFVFVEARPQPRILHVMTNGTSEWIERPFATGSGAVFAYALLRKYQDIELTLDRACLLALKVMEEAIEVGAYGVGHPICLWRVTPEGASRMEEPEVLALTDAWKKLREFEIGLLTGDVSMDEVEDGEVPLAEPGIPVPEKESPVSGLGVEAGGASHPVRRGANGEG